MLKLSLAALRLLAAAFVVNFTLQLGCVRVSIPRPALGRTQVASAARRADTPASRDAKTRGHRILRNTLISDRALPVLAAAAVPSHAASLAPQPLLGHEAVLDHPPA